MDQRLVQGAIIALIMMFVLQAPQLAIVTVGFISIYLMALALRPQKSDVIVKRALSHEETNDGAGIVVTVSVHNKGNAIHWCEVVDELPAGVVLNGSKNSQLFSLTRGGTRQWSYKFTACRGLYNWQKLHVKTGDFFGIFCDVSTYEVESQLSVYPNWNTVGRLFLTPSRLFGYDGRITSKQSGAGADSFGVRQYALGDSLKRVNWRVSAKHRSLFVRDCLLDRNTTVNIVVDARASVNKLEDHFDLFEKSLFAAASVADQCLREGHKVSVTLVGHRTKKSVAGVGRKQFKHILATLASAELGLEMGLESYHNRYFKYFDSRTVFVWVSPLIKKDFSPIRSLVAMGYDVAVLSPSLLHEIKETDVRHYLETVRGLIMNGIKSSGAVVLDWPCHKPLNSITKQMQLIKRR
jgi:uncharacterized protein (DUF58 family)